MRILVCPHLMEIGGSQRNALELAAETAKRGHEVVVLGPDGDLMPLVREWDLEYVVTPGPGGTWPSPRTMTTMVDLVRRRDVQVAHGYEWGPILELAFGPQTRLRTPVLGTVLSMEVPYFLPRHLPLVVGTAELAAQQAAVRRRTHLMEPPIDTTLNRSRGRRDEARAALGLDRSATVFGVVCRLSADLGKLDGVLTAVDLVGGLGPASDVQLLVVGDGPGLDDVRRRGAAVNAATGRTAVVVPGPMLDPRDAYEASDVVLGMGSSALKGMAFGKPLIVQGENGFWETLTPGTLPGFLDEGWWGHGSGNGAEALRPLLTRLAADDDARRDLGALGRRVVEERFSLTRAGEVLETIYEQTLAESRPHAGSLARSAYDTTKFKAFMALRQRPARRRQGAVKLRG